MSLTPWSKMRRLIRADLARARTVLMHVLRETGGNVEAVSRLLGRDRRTIYRFIAELEIDLYALRRERGAARRRKLSTVPKGAGRWAKIRALAGQGRVEALRARRWVAAFRESTRVD